MAKRYNEKFNEQICKDLCTAHEKGLPLKSCAQICGLNRNTVHLWLRKGKQSKSKYHQFYKDWQRANARFQAYHLKKINDSKDWKASKYLLEVNSPKDFVVKEHVNIEATHDQKKPKKTSIFDLVDQELKDIKE